MRATFCVQLPESLMCVERGGRLRVHHDHEHLAALGPLGSILEPLHGERLVGIDVAVGLSSARLAATGRLLNMLVSRSERSERAADAIESMVVLSLSGFETQAVRAEADFAALLEEAAADALSGSGDE